MRGDVEASGRRCCAGATGLWRMGVNYVKVRATLRLDSDGDTRMDMAREDRSSGGAAVRHSTVLLFAPAFDPGCVLGFVVATPDGGFALERGSATRRQTSSPRTPSRVPAIISANSPSGWRRFTLEAQRAAQGAVLAVTRRGLRRPQCLVTMISQRGFTPDCL